MNIVSVQSIVIALNLQGRTIKSQKNQQRRALKSVTFVMARTFT